MKKILVILIIFSFIGFSAYKIYIEIFSHGDPVAGPRKQVQAVEVSPVRLASLSHSTELSGSLVAESEFNVASKISARLEKLYFDIGDTVNRGDLIAQLESEEYVQQLQAARAEHEVARASLGESASELSVSERELNRALSLKKAGTLSQSELDQIQGAYDVRKARHEVAKALVRQKEAALEAARVRLSYTRIEARWDRGPDTRLVGRRFASEGAMLQANESILTLVDPFNLIAVVSVIERDFPFIRIGQTATVRADAFPDKTFAGRVIRYAPILEETTRQGRVEIMVSNPDLLLAPGMFARVRLEFTRHENITSVPAEALVRREEQKGVFIADTENMKARFVPVTAGIADEGLVEILSPEIEGMVITLGHHLLEDGMDIVIPGMKTDQKEAQEGL